MTTYQLADLFELVVDTVPDRVALVTSDGEARLTFRELDDAANRLANHLLELGLAPGTSVGIYAWNRTEWLEAMLGAYKARCVPINVNYRYVADELAYLFDDADLEVLVVERGFSDRVAEVAPAAPRLRHIVVLEDGSDLPLPPGATSYAEVTAAAPSSRPAIERSSDDHYVLYTGGTTGMPKGVVWRHEDIYFAALGGDGYGGPRIESPAEVAERIGPDDARTAMFVLPPLMHGAAQWVTFVALLGGGEVVVSTDHSLDADRAWSVVERERCTTISVVDDAIARPLADALDAHQDRYDLSSVIAIGSGGAIFSKTVKNQLQRHLPDVFMIDGFGASETGANSRQIDPEQGARFPRNDWTDVLDDDLRPVEPGSGTVGRLARRGNIPLGYHKDQAKTAATFLTDPDGVRWSVPGDHGTVDADGLITLLGRGSQCINSGGEKIYPEEVETALKSHPEVFDVLVVGMPDDRFGQKVAAIVQPRVGASPTLDALVEHCTASIAPYKVPRHLQLVDQIGRTPSGKADYTWAKQIVGQPS